MKLNVLALTKQSERYVFFYDEESADTLVQMLGEFARDPELDFTWDDATNLSYMICQKTENQA